MLGMKLALFIIAIILLLFVVYLDVDHKSSICGVFAFLAFATYEIFNSSNYGIRKITLGGGKHVLAHVANSDIERIKSELGVGNFRVISVEEYKNTDLLDENIIVVSKNENIQIQAKLKYYEGVFDKYYSTSNYDFVSIDYIINDIKEEIENPERLYFSPISKHNIKDIEKISVAKVQEKWVSNPTISMMQCSILSEFVGLAIIAENRIIGIITYGNYIPPDHNDVKTKIYKFMIDQNYQNKGYGRKALKKILSRFNDDLYLSVHSDNKAAIKIYSDTGFHAISESGDSIIMVYDGKNK